MGYYPSTEIKETGRVCTKCKLFKLWKDFHVSNGQKSGYRPNCIECGLIINKEYYYRNIEKVKERQRAASKTEYRRKWNREYQLARFHRERANKATRPMPNKCEVCGRDGGTKGIVLDHCHSIDKFRGWICGKCNTSIGLLNDSPVIMRLLADYVEKFKENNGELYANI